MQHVEALRVLTNYLAAVRIPEATLTVKYEVSLGKV